MKRIALGFLITIWISVCLGLLAFSPLHAQPSADDAQTSNSRDDILAIDRFVPHISTV